jgi:hypothetical protein
MLDDASCGKRSSTEGRTKGHAPRGQSVGSRVTPNGGLPLICVPRVPVGNTENYRVCRSQPADFAKVPVRQETAVFSAEIAHNSLAKTASLTVFFSGNFNVFHGTGTEP